MLFDTPFWADLFQTGGDHVCTATARKYKEARKGNLQASTYKPNQCHEIKNQMWSIATIFASKT